MPNSPQTETNKAKLEGWKDALNWVIAQFLDHEHGMTMGAFIPAMRNMIDAKINWVNAHECFKGDNHEPTGKVSE